MVIMWYAARPIVQLEGTLGFDKSHKMTRSKKDIPEEIIRRVNLMLLPNPDVESLKREPKTSPTMLLAGIVYYQIQWYLG